MAKKIIPSSSSGTGTSEFVEDRKILAELNSVKLWDYFAGELTKITNQQSQVKESIEALELESNKIKETIREQSNRNIEIIGIFSSVIALLITNVTIISTSDNFLKSMIIIISTACIVVIFATLIHYYFAVNTRKIKKGFYISIIILSVLLIFGIVVEVFKIEFPANLRKENTEQVNITEE